MSNILSILHISDLHSFTESSDYIKNEKAMLKSLYDMLGLRLRSRRKSEFQSPDIISITSSFDFEESRDDVIESSTYINNILNKIYGSKDATYNFVFANRYSENMKTSLNNIIDMQYRDNLDIYNNIYNKYADYIKCVLQHKSDNNVLNKENMLTTSSFVTSMKIKRTNVVDSIYCFDAENYYVKVKNRANYCHSSILSKMDMINSDVENSNPNTKCKYCYNIQNPSFEESLLSNAYNELLSLVNKNENEIYKNGYSFGSILGGKVRNYWMAVPYDLSFYQKMADWCDFNVAVGFGMIPAHLKYDTKNKIISLTIADSLDPADTVKNIFILAYCAGFLQSIMPDISLIYLGYLQPQLDISYSYIRVMDGITRTVAHIHDSTAIQEGAIMSKKIQELKKTWKHIEKAKLKALTSLEEADLNFLHDLFVRNEEIISNNVNEYDEINDILATDVRFDLQKNKTLLVRVCVCIEERNGKIIKAIQAANPLYAWIYDEYNDNKHRDFNNRIKEIYLKDSNY
ncbi:MAG: hypothetical protein LBI19_03160 [Oscillospiraceae bacterium]|nr:hypothetical protein [Oscillospiraceae bacterium]